MTDRIEAALAALPKATKGPWNDEYSFIVGPDEIIICYGFAWEEGKGAANQALCIAAPDLAAEVIWLREEVTKHTTAETSILARVREKIEALPVTTHPDYNCDFLDKDDALRAVDEVEKEAGE